MVSLRCKLIVKDKLKKMGINLISLNNSSLIVMEDITDKQIAILKKHLHTYGLIILDEPKSVIIDTINAELAKYVNNAKESEFEIQIATKLNKDFDHLNKLFSDVYGISIYQHSKIFEIEKVKELLLYDNYNIIQIAKLLKYKNPSTLTYLFKKITGLTPSFYKKLKQQRNKLQSKYSKTSK